MASTRELKGRINSVHSSQKITGAMKMISSARLRKSENALNHARPYMEQLQNILDHIASEINDYQSPLSQDRPVQRVAIVIFAGNEGLCGAFNLLLYKKLLETLKEYDGKVKSPVFVYPVGRKLVNDIKRTRGVEVMPIPDLFEKKQYAEGATALADELIHRFLDKVTGADWLGNVKENWLDHKIMVPFKLKGEYTVASIVAAGEYTIKDTIAVLKDETEKEIPEIGRSFR